MKLLVVLAVVAYASCDKFSADEIQTAQVQLIKDTIAKLQKMGQSTTGTFLDKYLGKVAGPVEIIKFINDNLGEMDKGMMAEAERRAKEGLPLVKKVFQDIHDNVYNWGRKTALTLDLPYYLAKNSTDGKMALAKFAVTTAVIDWRCKLDEERRTVHPTQCKSEQDGWNDWNAECDKVIAVLKDLIPKLHDLKSEFWAHQHERMLAYIEEGIPKLNEEIKAEPSEEKRAKYLCVFGEDLSLLNTVAAGRPPSK